MEKKSDNREKEGRKVAYGPILFIMAYTLVSWGVDANILGKNPTDLFACLL